jgi:hypothetical protein
MKLVSNRSRFINDVISETLVIFKRSKTTIEDDLLNRKYSKIDGSYSYLFNIKTYQYTSEAIAELTLLENTLKDQLDQLSKMSILDMWLLELF